MFLQFFLWGSWFATLGLCLGTNGFSEIIAKAYGTSPLGAIFAPLFLGIIADRFFPSQKVMGFLFLIGAVFLLLIPSTAEAAAKWTGDPDEPNPKENLMVWLMLGNMLCYMPTLALGNSIAFTHLDSMSFPKIRVWGTIGWIVAGLAVGGVPHLQVASSSRSEGAGPTALSSNLSSPPSRVLIEAGGDQGGHPLIPCL